MTEFQDKAVGDTPSVTNAAVGSPPDRCSDLPPEMHPESAAVPSPPSEIAAEVAALGPEIIRQFLAEPQPNPAEDWLELAERLGFEDADFVDPSQLPRVLAGVLLLTGQAHELSRQYPIEMLMVMGKAHGIFETECPEFLPKVMCAFLAPELVAAWLWIIENRTAEIYEALGLGHEIN